jgi:orotate phosphoribosyltransferase
MDDFQEEFVNGLADHEMVRVAENPEEAWTLTSERPHPDTGDDVEVRSPYYFNMTGFGYHEDVKEPLMKWLDEEVETGIVAGLNTGGNTMASAYSGYGIGNGSPVSVVPVRKAGGDDRYTGVDRLGLPDDRDIEGETVDIVDDVGTTGNSVAELHEVLEEAGAEVGSWNIAVDRMEGVQENAESHGADLNALVNAREALDILYETGYLGEDQYQMAVEYTENPMAWNQERGFI